MDNSPTTGIAEVIRIVAGSRPFAVYRSLPKQYIKTRIVDPGTSQCQVANFTEVGFQISGLRTLLSRMPFSNSCNVANREAIYPFARGPIRNFRAG